MDNGLQRAKRCIVVVLMALATAFSPGSARSGEQSFISLEVRDETLEKTLDQVSKISGYTIDLQSRWRDLPVTVRLVNLSLEQAVKKILDNRMNYAVIWDDKEKNISITGIEISPVGMVNPGVIWQQKGIGDEGIRFEQGSRANPGIIGQQKGISGQGIRFEQRSRTTKY